MTLPNSTADPRSNPFFWQKKSIKKVKFGRKIILESSQPCMNPGVFLNFNTSVLFSFMFNSLPFPSVCSILTKRTSKTFVNLKRKVEKLSHPNQTVSQKRRTQLWKVFSHSRCQIPLYQQFSFSLVQTEKNVDPQCLSPLQRQKTRQWESTTFFRWLVSTTQLQILVKN